MKINIVRSILTLVLLTLVWINSHWTVAITITLLAINDTLIRQIMAREISHRKGRQKAENDLFKKIKKLREEQQKK